MIRPEDVTDAMVVAAARVLNKRAAKACNADTDDQWRWYSEGFKNDARAAVAAAINASGCVLVPRNTLKILADTACAKGAMEHAEIMALGDVADLLAAADPREQALDRMAENAQELGLYDEGKEKDRE